MRERSQNKAIKCDIIDALARSDFNNKYSLPDDSQVDNDVEGDSTNQNLRTFEVEAESDTETAPQIDSESDLDTEMRSDTTSIFSDTSHISFMLDW